jgi:hypothetical protein
MSCGSWGGQIGKACEGARLRRAEGEGEGGIVRGIFSRAGQGGGSERESNGRRGIDGMVAGVGSSFPKSRIF